MIQSQSKGYIDIEIFEEWLIEILFSELQRRRELYACEGRVVVILDNFTSLRMEHNDFMHYAAKTTYFHFPPTTQLESTTISQSIILWPHEAITHPREPHG
jgi:hypothetical protein